jgi:small subunit ribosomal protein S2
MAPYIFDEKKGIHIIDLNKTAVKLEEATAAMKSIARGGKKVLFVATKKQAKDIVAEKGEAHGYALRYGALERWYAHQLRHDPSHHQEDGHHRSHEDRRHLREHEQA